MTNFYQHHGHGSHLPSSSAAAGSSSAAGPLCLPFYNQLNAISHHLGVHQQRRQWLPSCSADALRDTKNEMRRRKDDLIRHRYGLRQCQKKIFEFHIDQIEKRARNFDKFVSTHQTHWKDMQAARNSIIEETRKVECELKDMLQKRAEMPEETNESKEEAAEGSQKR